MLPASDFLWIHAAAFLEHAGLPFRPNDEVILEVLEMFHSRLKLSYPSDML